ncbi:MAG: hypothetical protein L3J39_10590 [Verrucomicrobiales bacterium]|nr:hypothetical protein [Verrucomicrobiales bacterium]
MLETKGISHFNKLDLGLYYYRNYSIRNNKEMVLEGRTYRVALDLSSSLQTAKLPDGFNEASIFRSKDPELSNEEQPVVVLYSWQDMMPGSFDEVIKTVQLHRSHCLIVTLQFSNN